MPKGKGSLAQSPLDLSIGFSSKYRMPRRPVDCKTSNPQAILGHYLANQLNNGLILTNISRAEILHHQVQSPLETMRTKMRVPVLELPLGLMGIWKMIMFGTTRFLKMNPCSALLFTSSYS